MRNEGTACGLIYLITFGSLVSKVACPRCTTICETGSLVNVKRLFKIEQVSFKLIEFISGFSGRKFKLDCLDTDFSDLCIKYTNTRAFFSFVSTLHKLS